MLTAFRLANFKPFAGIQTLPLRPLTLVFGPNSGGKSSLIHGLLLACNFGETGQADIQFTRLGGSQVDLGDFANYLHKGNFDAGLTIGLRLNDTNVRPNEEHLLTGISELEITSNLDFDTLRTCTIAADGTELLRLGREQESDLSIESINPNASVWQRIETSEQRRDKPNTTQPSPASEPNTGAERQMPPPLNSPERLREPTPSHLVGYGPWKVANSVSQDPTNVRLIPLAQRLLEHVAIAVAWTLQRVHYLGPFRSYTPREVLFGTPLDDDWDAAGGSAWHLLASDAQVQAAVARWIGDEDRMRRPYVLAPDDPRWGRLPKLPTRSGGNPILVDLQGEKAVTHRDIGVGLSQVIPVLSLAYGLKEYLLAIEQPELHLHPSLQAHLGDVFIESALGSNRNTLLLETHSEQLIRRIMRRMRDTVKGRSDGRPDVRPSDVSVVFVHPNDSGSVVGALELDDDGELLSAWPGGFFEESFNERFL
jgi:hypothetical protein